MARSDEVAREQAKVDAVYARIDELRRRTALALARVRRSQTGGTMQNRSERDAFATLHEDRLAQLEAVEDRLVFGRLDLREDGRRYIGRLGLSDDDQRQILLDWRAPAAEPFYSATAAEPGPVVRRRHLNTRARKVLGVEDELLDLEGADVSARSETLNGEGALMAALAEHRTGHMRDIVATIQAEQDRVIRAPLGGILVVQGGPGTGKTAVALHRAAYLLYAHRDRIARSGVLVVGPSPVFLRYIEQVLPSLGETGVVLSTPAQLLPGVEATGTEPAAVAALKGDRRMAKVLSAAVAERQRVPDSPRTLDVDGTRVVLRPDAVAAARARIRRTRKPHNEARTQFVGEVLDDLVAQLAEALGLHDDGDTRERLLADLRDARDVRREVNLCWMPLTPQRVLADLLADVERLRRLAPHLSEREAHLLRRDRSSPLTPADVPLLDELAELLGEDDTAQRLEQRRLAAERAASMEYARESLGLSGAGARGVTAQMLAERFADSGPSLSLAERASADRTWAFGHVVVDEAQELSPMAWRAILRRCPSRSMTVVGDIAQTSAPEGASSWADVFDRFARGRWRLAELTVNYRTPAEIMSVAARVLAVSGTGQRAPRSARSGQPPRAIPVGRLDAGAIEAVLRGELAADPEGRIAVLLPRSGHEHLAAQLPGRFPPGTVASGSGSLDASVAVMDVGQAKGLEFDTVLVLEPADIVEQSLRGAHDLYVALTRPTRRLLVVHARELPGALDGLAEQAA